MKSNALWVEMSEEISQDALAKAVADGTLTLTNLATQQPISITVTQPVLTGRQARRRLVITTTGPPATDTQVRLSLPATALQDAFLNQPEQDYQLTFAWPSTDAVFQDTKPIEVERVAVVDGFLEIELSEEPDFATTSAIEIDGGPIAWTLGEDRYTLKSVNPLAAGTHTLAIGTSLSDLNGSILAQVFSSNLSVVAHENLAVFEAPNPRETAVSAVGNLSGFQGHPSDSETGLLYVRNRYYDPELGRFVTIDPLGYADGPSAYAFTANNPLNMSDPLGLKLGDWWDIRSYSDVITPVVDWIKKPFIGLHKETKETGAAGSELSKSIDAGSGNRDEAIDSLIREDDNPRLPVHMHEQELRELGN
ncbi:MAG: RHS repeat-associated core domain-containing protein, partial [bacterium]